MTVKTLAAAMDTASVELPAKGEGRSLTYYASVGIDYFQHDHAAMYEPCKVAAVRAILLALKSSLSDRAVTDGMIAGACAAGEDPESRGGTMTRKMARRTFLAMVESILQEED